MRGNLALAESAAVSAADFGDKLLAMPDDAFASTWPQLGDPVRLQVPQATRQACIDRYRRLTPHVTHTIARLARPAFSGQVCRYRALRCYPQPT